MPELLANHHRARPDFLRPLLNHLPRGGETREYIQESQMTEPTFDSDHTCLLRVWH